MPSLLPKVPSHPEHSLLPKQEPQVRPSLHKQGPQNQRKPEPSPPKVRLLEALNLVHNKQSPLKVRLLLRVKRVRLVGNLHLEQMQL